MGQHRLKAGVPEPADDLFPQDRWLGLDDERPAASAQVVLHHIGQVIIADPDFFSLNEPKLNVVDRFFLRGRNGAARPAEAYIRHNVGDRFGRGQDEISHISFIGKSE